MEMIGLIVLYICLAICSIGLFVVSIKKDNTTLVLLSIIMMVLSFVVIVDELTECDKTDVEQQKITISDFEIPDGIEIEDQTIKILTIEGDTVLLIIEYK
jgi:hypothetical protein